MMRYGELTDELDRKLVKAIKKSKTLAAKYTLEYYLTHNPNDRYGKSGVSVTVMMEIEDYARWLEKRGYLK